METRQLIYHWQNAATRLSSPHQQFEPPARRAAKRSLSKTPESTPAIRKSKRAKLPQVPSRDTSSQMPGSVPLRASQREFVDLTVPEVRSVKRESSLPDPYEPETPVTGHKRMDGGSKRLLSEEILGGTSLLVRVNNQPDVAPAFINLGLCCNFEALFPVLISECEVQASTTMKITKISVTFPWSREQLRLRKGRDEDWAVFCSALRRRWEDKEDLGVGGCKVEMLVHVDG